MENNKYILDGSLEDQKEALENFLSDLSPEDIQRSQSSEFDYLDED